MKNCSASSEHLFFRTLFNFSFASACEVVTALGKKVLYEADFPFSCSMSMHFSLVHSSSLVPVAADSVPMHGMPLDLVLLID